MPCLTESERNWMRRRNSSASVPKHQLIDTRVSQLAWRPAPWLSKTTQPTSPNLGQSSNWTWHGSSLRVPWSRADKHGYNDNYCCGWCTERVGTWWVNFRFDLACTLCGTCTYDWETRNADVIMSALLCQDRCPPWRWRGFQISGLSNHSGPWWRTEQPREKILLRYMWVTNPLYRYDMRFLTDVVGGIAYGQMMVQGVRVQYGQWRLRGTGKMS